MNHDLFYEFVLKRLAAVTNIEARIKLLSTALPQEDWLKTKAKDEHKNLVFDPADHTKTMYAKDLITDEKRRLEEFGIWAPNIPKLSLLPQYSFFLQFPFALAKPYLSRDDEIFHICDSPVRKDKVFKVPMVSGSTWKGNLRWSATRLLVQKWEASKKENNNVKELAEGRLRLTLLFGDEKGEEPGNLKDVAKYLDKQSTDAAQEYRKLALKHFDVKAENLLPHHAGCLHFFPTFLDLISLEVINPHDRRTRAGTQPIYFESAPIGSKGIFSLLYLPLAYLGSPGNEVKVEVSKDLRIVYEALKEMMLTYGFSAKKKAGFGQIEDNFRIRGLSPSIGMLLMNGIPRTQTLANFAELKKSIDEAITAVPV